MVEPDVSTYLQAPSVGQVLTIFFNILLSAHRYALSVFEMILHVRLYMPFLFNAISIQCYFFRSVLSIIWFLNINKFFFTDAIGR